MVTFDIRVGDYILTSARSSCKWSTDTECPSSVDTDLYFVFCRHSDGHGVDLGNDTVSTSRRS